MIPIYVLTCDKFLPSVRGFAYQFNKYWSDKQEVTIVGFTPPTFELPYNFKFLSIGDTELPASEWSTGLLRLLHHMNENIFMLMLEDFWLRAPVEKEIVGRLYDMMRSYDNIARFDLTSDRQKTGGIFDWGRLGGIELVLSPPSTQYHLSLQAALWNKRALLEVIQPHESPWEVEINGSPRLGALGHEWLVLGTKQHPVKYSEAHHDGDASKVLTDGFTASDVKELESLGYL